MQSITSEEIKKQFEELLSFKSEEDKIELDAKELVFSFLSEFDKAMERNKVSKKELAKSIGTSASYITQLFRGDRTPNFANIAKMKEALNLEFDIKVKENNMLREEFHFPDVETSGWWVFKSLKPNYNTPTEEIEGGVLYNETEAA
jgi:ribosome-binding protein aMBF1 (putative translation factor)